MCVTYIDTHKLSEWENNAEIYLKNKEYYNFQIRLVNTLFLTISAESAQHLSEIMIPLLQFSGTPLNKPMHG